MLLITKSFPADVPVTHASEGQHRVGRVEAGDAVAACDQFAREEAGAAAEIEHGAHALRVGTPKLMER
jgi:hypothetical protein